jgi:hypothetical protein
VAASAAPRPHLDPPRADERAQRALDAEGVEAVVADLAEKHADELERNVERLRAMAVELRGRASS